MYPVFHLTKYTHSAFKFSFYIYKEIWELYQMWDFKDLFKYSYFLVRGCSEGCIISRRPLPVHMRLFIPWPFLSVRQTTQRMSLVAHTEPCGWLNAWELRSFRSEVSPGEITFTIMLLFLCDLFAVERGVYRVLLCSTVDIKGSIKLPLLIAKLNRYIKGEVQDGFFPPFKVIT